MTTIPGVSRKERQIIDYIKNFVGKLGFSYHEDDNSRSIAGETGNLICKVNNSKKNSVTYLLAAHVDTITVSCESPLVKDGKILSSDERILGADDRVGVTVLLEILKLIANKDIDYPNLEIVFLISEELGLMGSANLDYSQITARHAFNFDSSAPVGNVITEAPGKVGFEIRFIGQEAHSAVAPENGINAITMAAQAICRFNLPQKSEDTIFNIGIIKGGTARNVIPGEVAVEGELRNFDREKVRKYLAQVSEIAQSVVDDFGGKLSVNETVSYRSYKISETSPVFKIARAAVKQANRKFVPLRCWAGSDANVFNYKCISAVNIGLGYKNNHSSNEYVLVSDLIKDVEIGACIVQNAVHYNRKS